jgi:hypothetical protein
MFTEYEPIARPNPAASITQVFRPRVATLSGMASGLLRQEQDAGNNESHQNAGSTVAAERKAAMVNRLVEQIAQGGRRAVA